MAASYPGAVKTFATRSNGQSIDPSHINDLQDEVSAIESGLLNGTAALNSSATVVASLAVTSSTLSVSTQTYIFPADRPTAGQVLTAASTSGSTTTLGWAANGAVNTNYLLLRTATEQGIADVTETTLNWLTETDPAGFHSTASNSSIAVVPTGSSGLYQMTANVRFKNSANVSAVYLYLDGAEVARSIRSDASGGDATMSLTHLAVLNAAAEVKWRVYSNVGTTNSVSSLSYAAMVKLGG